MVKRQQKEDIEEKELFGYLEVLLDFAWLEKLLED